MRPHSFLLLAACLQLAAASGTPPPHWVTGRGSVGAANRTSAAVSRCNSVTLIRAPLSYGPDYEANYRARQECDFVPAENADTVWRFEYVDEQTRQGSRVLVVEDSLDARLANTVYTSLSRKPVSLDINVFDTGDASRDAANLAAVTPATADDALCERQLDRMLELLHELASQNEAKRNNATAAKMPLAPAHISLARLLDSYARYESGLLTGYTHLLGNFDQCIGTRLDLGAALGQRVPARYCWARLDIHKHLDPRLATKPTSTYEPEDPALSVGICLPQACHTRAFLASTAGAERASRNLERVNRLVRTQFRLPRELFIEESLDVKQVFCIADPERQHEMSLAGRLTLIALAGWLLLVVYATYYFATSRHHQAALHKKNDDADRKQDSGFLDSHPRARSLLQCLDLKRSWLEFVCDDTLTNDATPATEPKSRLVDLNVLNPVKVLGCAYVILGHAFLFQISLSKSTVQTYQKAENDPIVFSMAVGTVIVDTFLVITGLIVGYLTLRRAHRRVGTLASADLSLDVTTAMASNGTPLVNGKGGHPTGSDDGISRDGRPILRRFLDGWAHIAAKRYLRLVPIFFLVHWLTRWLIVDGLGPSVPMWDNGFNRHTTMGGCREEPWWSPLALRTAFMPLSRQCISASWSVSVDVIIISATAPVVLLMAWRPKRALLAGGLASALAYLHSLRGYLDIDPVVIGRFSTLRLHEFGSFMGAYYPLYTHPVYRLPQMFIGLAAGYVLHKWETAGAKDSQWIHWLRGPITWLSLVTPFLMLGFAGHLRSLIPYAGPYKTLLTIHIFTTGRVIWALTNAVLFVRMLTDWRNSFLMQLFRGKFFSILSNLNLVILLIHMQALCADFINRESLPEFTLYELSKTFRGVYMNCLLLGTILHVVFERPIDKLMRHHVMPLLPRL